MYLRMDIAFVALVALSVVGCRFKGGESMRSSSAPTVKSPYKGDPYTFGGIQDGTGGLIAATRSSMETETYSEPKFKALAGPNGFLSMTGHSLSPAKSSDIQGDYQPLPSEEVHKDAGHEASSQDQGH